MQTTTYMPGSTYNVSSGFSQATFEGRGIGKAVPVEKGLIFNGDAVNKSILFANLSGRDVDIVISHTEVLNQTMPKERWNENEIDGFLLPAGQGTHLPVDPSFYTVSVQECEIGENGKEFWTTLLGLQYNNIINRSISLFDGDKTGEVDTKSSKSTQENYTAIISHLNRPVRVVLSRETIAYSLTEQELNLERSSRSPDLGGKVLREDELPPNSTWWTHLPKRRWAIRALLPDIPASNAVSFCNVVPNQRNYVQMAMCEATAGTVVVALKDGTGNGGVILVPYEYDTIKAVVSDICITRNRYI